MRWVMRKSLIHWLGLTGIVALLSYTVALIFAPLAYPGYNWMAQAVSDLSAETAPSRQLWNRLAAPYHIFGAKASYAELVCFQISEEYRRQGIGRRLFSMVCEEALRLGAEKLYISSHSSKESQAAYRALGCTPAEEINASLAAEEPFDVQLEYRL